VISEQNVLTLLNLKRLPGSIEQRRKLVVRIGELVELNGETWVRQNSENLLREWEAILRLKIV
jgi:hypothetical protein